jgi:hypothetical protein
MPANMHIDGGYSASRGKSCDPPSTNYPVTLAGLIGSRFFDMDDEIEAFFGATIATSRSLPRTQRTRSFRHRTTGAPPATSNNGSNRGSGVKYSAGRAAARTMPDHSHHRWGGGL